jgi:hypothetical protein
MQRIYKAKVIYRTFRLVRNKIIVVNNLCYKPFRYNNNKFKMKQSIKNRVRVAICTRTKQDLPVQNDLALTPAKVLEMAEKGIPVSAQASVDNFYDGEQNVSWDALSLDEQRGVDIVDMWNAEKDIKGRIKQKSFELEQQKQKGAQNEPI